MSTIAANNPASSTPLPTLAAPNVGPDPHPQVEVAARDTIEYPVAFGLSGCSPALSFNPKAILGPLPCFGFDASLVLVSARIELSVGGGNSIWCLWAITGSNEAPANSPSQVYGGRVNGNAQSATERAIELPSNHFFGKELKLPALGNPTPRFHFKLKGAGTSSRVFDAHIRIIFTLRRGGQGVYQGLYRETRPSTKSTGTGT